MAAPVATMFASIVFRDAKGQTAKMRVLVGGATIAAVQTNIGTLEGHLAAMSNATTRVPAFDGPIVTYGGTGQFQDVEDKAQLVFVDPAFLPHRYQVPSPIAAAFKADLETVDAANAAVAAVITDFQTFVYGRGSDTAPLAYRGGIRLRRRMIRKFNIYTKDPGLTGEGE